MTIPLWLTYGLSGSGKSTWARKFADDSYGQIVRLSMDDVRATLGAPSGSPRWSKEFEGVAFHAMLAMARALVADGKSVIFDNTHLSPSMPTQIAKAFRQHDVLFKVQDFSNVPIDVCVYRDSNRPQGVRVGPEVIARQAKTLRTAKSGGLPFVLTPEWLNDFLLEVQPYKRPPLGSRPKAVIFDVDGTLTLGPKNRTPYEWHKVLNDDPRPFLIYLAQKLKADGYQVLAVSGRSDVCRRESLYWFSRHGVQIDRFPMRAAGDNRSDDLIKLELFNREIRDHYDVHAVFDDRDQVVSMWRLLGLQTLQVANGSF